MIAVDDELIIVAAGRRISVWESVEVTRGIERFPSSFSVTYTELSAGVVPLKKGDPCQVFAGSDLLLTGYIDAKAIEFAPGTHKITVRGRSKCRQLHDCSAVLGSISPATISFGNVNSVLLSASIDGAPAEIIAQRLAQPFGITVTGLTDSWGGDVPSFAVNLGETPYQIIERVCRWTGFLVYDGTDGNLILSQAGNARMASGFKQGVNVERFSHEQSEEAEFSDYIVLWQSVDSLRDVAPNSNAHGLAVDPDVQSFRPLILISEQSIQGQDIAQRVALWEAQRRWGRARSVRVSVPGWRDSAGKLWEPNNLAPVYLPEAGLDDLWLMSEVTYRRDLAGGTMSEITLMPPEAYKVEPVVPPQVDADINAAAGGASPDN